MKAIAEKTLWQQSTSFGNLQDKGGPFVENDTMICHDNRIYQTKQSIK